MKWGRRGGFVIIRSDQLQLIHLTPLGYSVVWIQIRAYSHWCCLFCFKWIPVRFHGLYGSFGVVWTLICPCTGPWWILLFEGGYRTIHGPGAAGQSVEPEEHHWWNQELGPNGNDQAVWGQDQWFCNSGGIWNIQQLPGHSTEREGSGTAAPQPRLWTTSPSATSWLRPGALGGNMQTQWAAELL